MYESIVSTAPPYLEFLEEDKTTINEYRLLSALSFILCPVLSLLALYFTDRLEAAREAKDKMAAAERVHIVRICLYLSVCVGITTYSLLIGILFYINT